MSDKNNMFGNGPDMTGGYTNGGYGDPTGGFGQEQAFQQQYGMGGVPPHFGHPPPPPPYGYYPPPPPGYYPYGHYPPPNTAESSATQQGMQQALNQMADENGLGFLKGLVDFNDGDFWKGALVGAAAVLLITNEDLRDSLMENVAKAAESLKEGLGGLADEEVEEGGAEQTADATPDENSEEVKA